MIVPTTSESEEELAEEEEEEEDMVEDATQVGLDPSVSEADGACANEATAPTDVGSAGDDPVPSAPKVQQELSESKAPASPTEPANLLDSLARSPDKPNSSKAWEGGYRSNRPSDALILHNSSHPPHLTQLITHNSSHPTHLAQLITSTHLTPLSTSHSSHPTHLTQLITHTYGYAY